VSKIFIVYAGIYQIGMSATGQDEAETESLTDYLYDHPRMMGALFTLVLLLSQAGSAVAGNAGSCCGP
jgi:hypothetical protein